MLQRCSGFSPAISGFSRLWHRVSRSLFPQVDINAVLLVAERVAPDAQTQDRTALRFVTFKSPIANILTGTGNYWNRVVRLTDRIYDPEESYEDSDLRIKIVPLSQERHALATEPKITRNWSEVSPRTPQRRHTLRRRYLICSCRCLELAHAALGYKSLQNDFFYVGKNTIETYGIEKQYLNRSSCSGTWIPLSTYRLHAATVAFSLSGGRTRLRGTGAYRYIQTMSERAATQRKQSGTVQTIREALELQGKPIYGTHLRQPRIIITSG